MRREEIINLMNRQTSLEDDTLKDLQNLLEEYPYFQTAQILYTLGLQANKDTRFNAALRKSACYTGDRRKLFYLVEEKFFTPSILQNLEEDENATDSSFDLIDFFLAGKEKEENQRAKRMVLDSEPVSADYLSYILSEETQKEDKEVLPMQHQQAIDDFLEKDEKIAIKLDVKDIEEEVFPEQEVVNQESFFSETLAKIYLKQKKYEKSLEIIRKLSLLYPEKNRYFADQIRFLEKLIINKQK
jgi:hypothetical protein